MEKMEILIKGVNKTSDVKDYYVDRNGKYIFKYKSGQKEEVFEDEVDITKKKVILADNQILICKGENKNGSKEIIMIGDKITRIILDNGKHYDYKSNNINIENAIRKKIVTEQDIICIDDEMKAIELLYYFDNWVKVKFKNSNDFYVYKREKITEKKKLNSDYISLINYYKEIAKVKDIEISDEVENYLGKQLNDMVITEETALNCFFSRKTSKEESGNNFTIYPFGINLSQREGIMNVYDNQISLIQGPPGTGKTASILNILANLILREKKIAVVSSNNEAVKNVLEKMQKSNYDFIISFLGKTSNKEAFFLKQPEYPFELKKWKKTVEIRQKLKEEIIEHEKKLIDMLHKQNELSIVREQLREYKHEYQFFEAYLVEKELKKLRRLSFFKMEKSKIMNLIVELDIIGVDRLTVFNKVYNFFKYGIYDYKQFDKDVDAILLELKDEYYKSAIIALEQQQKQLCSYLSTCSFVEEENSLVKKSQCFFQAYLADKYCDEERVKFNIDNYFHTQKFKEFINEYPIILSTTHAINKSKSRDFIFDYIIFDEASQIELVPGVIALNTAKNAIIVGDLKQLPHIPDKKINKKQYDEWHEKYNVDYQYDYKNQSLLSSVSNIFYGEIPSVLLKEHYRCHHRIISFSNKKYYNNELVCHTNIDCDRPLVLIRTVEGNHMRYGENAVNKITNVRELDSLVDIEFLDKANIDFQCNKEFGFIAPFRGQVNKSNEYFPESFQKDTVHKFQGRECEIVMFSSVLDKKSANKFNMEFVDDPKLINVAISRAKEKFILVSNVDVFKEANGEINDLIRYMEYYEEESILFQSNVRSIFDLLYADNKDALNRLKSKTYWGKSKYDSENLMENLIREILLDAENNKYKYACQVLLKELIRNSFLLNDRELTYINNNASADFIIYNKFDNQPILAIEVDGFYFHENNPKQLKKDEMKKEIFTKYGINFISIKTNGSDEEKKIRELL